MKGNQTQDCRQTSATGFWKEGRGTEKVVETEVTFRFKKNHLGDDNERVRNVLFRVRRLEKEREKTTKKGN